ncbi:MAG TPA: proton-conducting transporter membrane subunit [Clostridia bacterium]|nr:proton-conducting transporter membrane subunit [Clostridia bacterium]
MSSILNGIPYVFVAAPLFAFILNNAVPRERMRSHAVALSGGVAALQLAAAILGFALLAASGRGEVRFGLFWSVDAAGAAYLRVNLVSLFLLLCVGFVALASALTAAKTIDDHRCSFANLFMALLLGMNGMLLATDLFTLYVFLEITGTASFVLIAMYKSSKGLEGAFKYLTMSALATIMMLTGLALLFMHTGSLAFADLGAAALSGASGEMDILCYGALALLISGFAIKAGAAPFHSWLPDAHQSADTAVSILLSGIVIKIAGAYGFIVLVELFGDLYAVRLSVAALGVATIAFGALLALVQTHFKRIAAYSSVSQVGYILFGIAAGSPLGLVGALLHVFSHAAFKSTLFSCAAALHEQLGTLDIEQMGGLQKNMPVTGFASVTSFLSAAGVPPFAGFWSKLLILISLWQAGWIGLSAAALGLSILTGAYFLRLQKKVFFGPRNPRWDDVKEIGGTIRASQIVLSAVNLGAGLCFPLVLLYLQSIGLI